MALGAIYGLSPGGSIPRHNVWLKAVMCSGRWVSPVGSQVSSFPNFHPTPIPHRSTMMLSKSVFSRKMSIISATKRGPRFISSPSVHTSFPATMYRFQLRRESSLFHNKIKNGGFFRDGVEIADDGLVYLRLSSTQNCSQASIITPPAQF